MNQKGDRAGGGGEGGEGRGGAYSRLAIISNISTKRGLLFAGAINRGTAIIRGFTVF